MNKESPKNIDEYITNFPKEIQAILQELRRQILLAAPAAKEKISWGMATFQYHGNLVHFAAQKNHLGLYPGPSAITFFQKELIPYPCSKGAIRFAYDQPIPYGLIQQIVQFRIKEQDTIAATRKTDKKQRQSPSTD